MPLQKLRQTKIVATMGPACSSDQQILELIKAGCDLMRLNGSHMNASQLKQRIAHIRRLCTKNHLEVPIMVDLQGPRLRTGELFNDEPMFLRAGQSVILDSDAKRNSPNIIAVPCTQLIGMVNVGDAILLDNGIMELKAKRKVGKRFHCIVKVGGKLGRNKGINLPKAPMTLPALSAKDKADVRAAVSAKADFLALSFVRSELDVIVLKKLLKSLKSNIPIIAKIEKPSAVDHIDAIMDHAHGIMVARGDLGIEAGVEKVPVIQKRLIEKANAKGVPVITATQMLESMIESSTPTRAEASDVANAVFDGTDAVMLSGETAIGHSPINCIRIMCKIINEAEADGLSDFRYRMNEKFSQSDHLLGATVHAGCASAERVKAKAIVVYTSSGKTSRWVSKLRPASRVIALCFDPVTARRCVLGFGIRALIIPKKRNTDLLIAAGEKAVKKYMSLKKGDHLVIVAGRLALRGSQYMTKIDQI
ncbi:MAG: pyruvate kinase [Candidatus Omnitrophota bacterium]|jgi:pyruvate kinase